jgi:hypothetical protein
VCDEKENPSCSEVYAGCSIDWPRTYAGCTTGRACTYACCIIDKSRTCDILISVEDFFLISVGVEGVIRVFHVRAGALVKLHSI